MKPNHTPLTHSEEAILRQAVVLTIKLAVTSFGILATTMFVMYQMILHSEDINRFLTSIIP